MRKCLVLLALLAVWGCRADIGANPSAYEEPLVAVFDPNNGVIPMPNDILISAGGQVRIPTELTTSDGKTVKAFEPAMEELVKTYLNRLDAFPPEQPITVAFFRSDLGKDSAPIDQLTLDGALRVFDVTGLAAAVQEALAAQRDPASDEKVQSAQVTEVTGIAVGPVLVTTTATGLTTLQVTYKPGSQWQPGHRYIAFLTTAVRDEKKRPVAAPLVMNYLKSKESLVKDPDPDIPGDEYAVVAIDAKNQDEADKLARELEAIRLSLKPFLDYFGADSRGQNRVTRDQIALVWTFSITRYPLVVFDADHGVIPMPNDALRDASTGRLDFPLPEGVRCEDASTIEALPEEARIQGDFFCFMDAQDGFDAVSSVTFPVTAAPDASTLVPDNAKLFDVTASPAVEVSDVKAQLSLDGRAVVLDPKGLLVPGHRYAAILVNQIGRQAGTEDHPEFQPLSPSTPLALLRLTTPLTKEGKSAMPGTLSDQDAQRLEAMRSAMAKDLDAIEAAGFDRGSLAGFAVFTVASTNQAIFDPASGNIPFPNDILIDQKTQKVALPVGPADPSALAAMKSDLCTLDGFSTVAPVSAPFVRPLDQSSLKLAESLLDVSTASLAFVDITRVNPTDPSTLSNIEVLGKDRIEVSFDSSANQLQFAPRPGRPLPPKSRFLVAVFDRVQNEGGSGKVAPSPFFVLLRSKYILAKDGKSTIPQVLGDSDASQLETLRKAYAPVLDALQGLGLGREHVLLLFTFTTESTTDELSELAAAVGTPSVYGEAMDLSPAGAPGVKELFVIPEDERFGAATEYPHDKVSEVCLDCALKGKVLLQPPDLSDKEHPKLGRFPASGAQGFKEDQKLPFLLFLPAGSPPQGGWPVAVFQHGLGSSRRQVAAFVNDLLAAGHVVVAMDAPYHGDHPIRIPGTPDGTGFFSADVFAVRDNIREVALEHRQLVRFISKSLDAWLVEKGKPAGTVNGNDIRYVGVSLGGITGAVTMAINPEFRRVALVVAGGHLTRVFLETENADFRDPLIKALAAMQIVPGTPEFNLFVTIAQMVLDRADPVNYAPVVPGKPKERVFMVEAHGDEFIPNTTTAELHDALAIPDGTPPELAVFPESGAGKVCHGFFMAGCDKNKYPEAESARASARKAVLDFLAK